MTADDRHFQGRLHKIFTAPGFTISRDAEAALQKLFDDMQERIDELEEKASDAENESKQEEAVANEAESAVDELMSTLDRPVGGRTFTIAHQAQFDRAVIGLCDALGRTF